MAKKNKFTRKKQTGGMYAYGMMPGMGMMNNGYGTGYPYGVAGGMGMTGMGMTGMGGMGMGGMTGMGGVPMMNNGYGGAITGAQMMNNPYGYGAGYPYGSMISSGGGRKKVYKSTKSRRSKVGGTSKTRGKPRKSRRRKN